MLNLCCAFVMHNNGHALSKVLTYKPHLIMRIGKGGGRASSSFQVLHTLIQIHCDNSYLRRFSYIKLIVKINIIIKLQCTHYE